MGIVGISAGIVVMLTHVVSPHILRRARPLLLFQAGTEGHVHTDALRSMRFRPRSVGSENKKRHDSP